MSLKKKHGVDYNQFADTYNFKSNGFIYLWITDILQGLVFSEVKKWKKRTSSSSYEKRSSYFFEGIKSLEGDKCKFHKEKVS